MFDDMIMNGLMLLIISFVIGGAQAFGQKVYSVDHEYQADVKVFVVDAEYKADLVVYKTDKEYEAKKERTRESGSLPISLIEPIRKFSLLTVNTKLVSKYSLQKRNIVPPGKRMTRNLFYTDYGDV